MLMVIIPKEEDETAHKCQKGQRADPVPEAPT